MEPRLAQAYSWVRKRVNAQVRRPARGLQRRSSPSVTLMPPTTSAHRLYRRATSMFTRDHTITPPTPIRNILEKIQYPWNLHPVLGDPHPKSDRSFDMESRTPITPSTQYSRRRANMNTSIRQK